jgi:thiamine biosynthesis lipoprotein
MSEKAVLPDRYVTSAIFMDTLVTIDVAEPGSTGDRAERVRDAFGWFAHVERVCSRFDRRSELSHLSASPIGVPISVSPLLFELIDFACSVARASDGAFDPTVGRAMETNGFNRDYLTGELTSSSIGAMSHCSYLDVLLDPGSRAVTLVKPLVLDLGAVAKGFAIDLAAEELRPFGNFAINAGGDILAHGRHSPDTPWHIGIRHPRAPGDQIDSLVISDAAVCTSGDYERPRPDGKPGHHILDPRTGKSTEGVASVTVVASSAMLADAMSTAAFALGPERAVEFLESQGVEGLIVSADVRTFETKGLWKYRS